MPDLSNLLGAVYGDSPTSTPRDPEDEAHVEHEPAAEDRGPAVPEWADDDHLDAAFAQWKPGPSDDASPAEHAFVKQTDDDDLPPPLPDDLAAALSEALVASSGTVRDTDIDVADADAYGGPKPKAYDFSLVDDDVEPIAEVQPVHQVDEAEEPEAVAQIEAPEPVAQIEAPEPVAQVDAPVEEPEVPEVPEVDAASNLHAVPEVSEVDDVEEDDEDETEEAETDERAEHAAPVEESDDHLLRRMPSLTPQREAAAELTAANRPEAESVFAPPSPEPAPQPEPAPVASTQTVPVAAVPEPMSAPAPAPIATLPAGASRWDRSEDDILPEKQSKKFFSFSLRRG